MARNTQVLDRSYNIAVSEVVMDEFQAAMKREWVARSQSRPDYEQNPESRELMMPVDRYDLMSMVLGQMGSGRDTINYTETELRKLTNRQLFTLYMDLKIERITMSMRKA